MDFKNIDKKYRPIPFWSWNEKLNPDETVRQAEMMHEMGIGGYFMHARGGLETPYMGEEWFENVAACIAHSKQCGMHPWAYDENGWPSGFGDGKVNGKGEKFWQKYLRMQPADADRSQIPAHRILKVTDRHCFYYDVNRFYVDTLDAEVIADFINEVYQVYYDRFGASFDGFFTDEPQISRNGIPWSLTLTDQYQKAYGENLLEVLECLFLQEGDFENVRLRFWKLVTELFSSSYSKQIYEWCTAHGYQFTGHFVYEETLFDQIVTNGACMPHYEYFSIPGMDWLGRNIYPCLTHHQVASAAAQTGKKQVISETFALCGHNVSHDELKRNYEWMMVRGINLLCQHLEGYSLRGIRKRDYPPAMYYQQPWWSEYKVFNDAMSRIGMILAEGKICFDTLLLHNISSAWICFNNGDNIYHDRTLDSYNQSLVDATLALEAKHIPFHLGDEILLERHGRVEGNKLIIGEQSYTTVVLPDHIRFLPHTEKLLAEFKANGGIVTTVDALCPNPVVDNEAITYTWRAFDGFTAHYFVNTNNFECSATINRGSYTIDIETGEKIPFTGKHTFPPYGSLMVIDDGTAPAQPKEEKALKCLNLQGDWEIQHISMNSLTLDKCDYWFDGELQEENGYILNVCQRAYTLERAVDVHCRFRVNLEYIPEKLYLACETPDILTIEINGQKIQKQDCGYFRDSAFRMLDVQKYVRTGCNTIDVYTTIELTAETYQRIRNAAIFEAERNKLTYEMELEAIYLVGDFTVRCDGDFQPIANDAYFFNGSFAVTQPKKQIKLHDLEQNGYPFFSGEIVLTKTFQLEDPNYRICFQKKGINVVKLTVNGKHIRTMLWAPYEMDISDYLHVGENTVEITILNNLRNLLGPHHHGDGELVHVSPRSFYKEACVFTGFHTNPYTDDYCFVSTGLI